MKIKVQSPKSKVPSPESRVPSPKTWDLEKESDFVVAIIRTALIVIAMIAPRQIETSEGTLQAMTVVTVCAAAFNMAVILALLLNLRTRGGRTVMLAMDIIFVSSWVALTWQPGLGPGEAYSPLFPYLYIVVCIGALWYHVTGALLSAVALAFAYLFAIHMRTEDPIALVDALFREVVYVFLVAVTAGYLVDVSVRRQVQYLTTQRLLREYQARFRFAQGDYESLLVRTPPLIPRLDIATRWEVALSEGGGDFYDVIRIDDRRTLFVIADVSGKATRSAQKLPLFKLAVQSVAQELAGGPPSSALTLPVERTSSPAEPFPVGELLTRVNRIVFASLQPDMFIGACVLVIDCDPGRRLPFRDELPETRDPRPQTPTATLTYANAGQDPPILVRRRTLEPVQLRTGDLVLGVEEDQAYHAQTLTLEAGDVLCLYTDGFTEARNPEGREYGYPDLEGRLRAAVGSDLSANATAENIYQAVREHVKDASLRDDRALVIVRYLPESRAPSP